MAVESVAVGANFVVVTHGKNNAAIPIFATANWNTTIYDSTSERTADTAKLYFGTSAEGAAPQVTWRIVE